MRNKFSKTRVLALAGALSLLAPTRPDLIATLPRPLDTVRAARRGKRALKAPVEKEGGSDSLPKCNALARKKVSCLLLPFLLHAAEGSNSSWSALGYPCGDKDGGGTGHGFSGTGVQTWANWQSVTQEWCLGKCMEALNATLTQTVSPNSYTDFCCEHRTTTNGGGGCAFKPLAEQYHSAELIDASSMMLSETDLNGGSTPSPTPPTCVACPGYDLANSTIWSCSCAHSSSITLSCGHHDYPNARTSSYSSVCPDHMARPTVTLSAECGSTYCVSNNRLNFAEAESFCAGLNMILATPKTQAENDAVHTACGTSQYDYTVGGTTSVSQNCWLERAMPLRAFPAIAAFFPPSLVFFLSVLAVACGPQSSARITECAARRLSRACSQTDSSAKSEKTPQTSAAPNTNHSRNPLFAARDDVPARLVASCGVTSPRTDGQSPRSGPRASGERSPPDAILLVANASRERETKERFYVQAVADFEQALEEQLAQQRRRKEARERLNLAAGKSTIAEKRKAPKVAPLNSLEDVLAAIARDSSSSSSSSSSDSDDDSD